MTKTYLVSTVATGTDGRIQTSTVGRFADKAKAMNAAKRAAHTRSDCKTYGPSSLCYVGREITAVVAW
jgi:hypothetical protein